MRINGRLQNSSMYHVTKDRITNQKPSWYRRNEQRNQSARAEETFESFHIKYTKNDHILDHKRNLCELK